ncbi:alpha/beta fold hydrolase [Acidobacteria bacterium AB60]|nr:alpha/beta fold hydrolase [Acidobacteria bacterium AB60]
MITADATPLPGPRTAGAKVRTVDLIGPAGRLEAVINEGDPSAPMAALVCHPHPAGGGTMHNKVVYHAMKALNAPEWGLRWPVLRFNFRGVGRSEGEHDGFAETGDVVAALAWLRDAYQCPIVSVGFSFGAAIALQALCGECKEKVAPVQAIAALGLPVNGGGRAYHYGFLRNCGIPKLFLSGDRDQFASAESLEKIVEQAAGPRKMVLIPGADHFFTGQLERMQQALVAWSKEQVP